MWRTQGWHKWSFASEQFLTLPPPPPHAFSLKELQSLSRGMLSGDVSLVNGSALSFFGSVEVEKDGPDLALLRYIPQHRLFLNQKLPFERFPSGLQQYEDNIFCLAGKFRHLVVGS